MATLGVALSWYSHLGTGVDAHALMKGKVGKQRFQTTQMAKVFGPVRIQTAAWATSPKCGRDTYRKLSHTQDSNRSRRQGR